MTEQSEQVEIKAESSPPLISNNLFEIQQHVDVTKTENFESISLVDESILGALKNFAIEMKLRFVSSPNLRSHIHILHKFRSAIS